MALLLWVIMKRYMILEDSFLLDSVCYRDDVMTALKFDWSNLKIFMSGWHRKLTSSCVSFTIYQQCHTDIEGDVTPLSLQYQNIHWDVIFEETISLVCRLSNSGKGKAKNTFHKCEYEKRESVTATFWHVEANINSIKILKNYLWKVHI